MRLRSVLTRAYGLLSGPKVYKTLSLLQGTGGYSCRTVPSAPSRLRYRMRLATVGTLIDAKGIAAELDELTLDSTREASLQLSDTPSSGEQTGVSLWQTTRQD